MEKLLPKGLTSLFESEEVNERHFKIMLHGWRECLEICMGLGLQPAPSACGRGRHDYEEESWDRKFWLANDIQGSWPADTAGPPAVRGRRGECGAEIWWDSRTRAIIEVKTGRVLYCVENYTLMEEIAVGVHAEANLYGEEHWTTVDLYGLYDGEWCVWDHAEKICSRCGDEQEAKEAFRKAKAKNRSYKEPGKCEPIQDNGSLVSSLATSLSSSQLNPQRCKDSEKTSLDMSSTEDREHEPEFQHKDQGTSPGVISGVQDTSNRSQDSPNEASWRSVFHSNATVDSESAHLDGTKLRSIMLLLDADYPSEAAEKVMPYHILSELTDLLIMAAAVHNKWTYRRRLLCGAHVRLCMRHEPSLFPESHYESHRGRR